ncbi:MAG: hypothetical protein ACT6SU_30760, partial [Variovorax sp.]
MSLSRFRAAGAPTFALHTALHAALALGVFAAAALPEAARAQEPDEIRSFSVPAGPLDAALDRFARSAGVNLSYDPALVADNPIFGAATNPSGFAYPAAG